MRVTCWRQRLWGTSQRRKVAERRSLSRTRRPSRCSSSRKTPARARRRGRGRAAAVVAYPAGGRRELWRRPAPSPAASGVAVGLRRHPPSCRRAPRNGDARARTRHLLGPREGDSSSLGEDPPNTQRVRAGYSSTHAQRAACRDSARLQGPGCTPSVQTVDNTCPRGCARSSLRVMVTISSLGRASGPCVDVCGLCSAAHVQHEQAAVRARLLVSGRAAWCASRVHQRAARALRKQRTRRRAATRSAAAATHRATAAADAPPRAVRRERAERLLAAAAQPPRLKRRGRDHRSGRQLRAWQTRRWRRQRGNKRHSYRVQARAQAEPLHLGRCAALRGLERLALLRRTRSPRRRSSMPRTPVHARGGARCSRRSRTTAARAKDEPAAAAAWRRGVARVASTLALALVMLTVARITSPPPPDAGANARRPPLGQGVSADVCASPSRASTGAAILGLFALLPPGGRPGAPHPPLLQ